MFCVTDLNASVTFIGVVKTNVQAFGDILDTTIESIPVSGKNVEVTQTFT